MRTIDLYQIWTCDKLGSDRYRVSYFRAFFTASTKIRRTYTYIYIYCLHYIIYLGNCVRGQRPCNLTAVALNTKYKYIYTGIYLSEAYIYTAKGNHVLSAPTMTDVRTLLVETLFLHTSSRSGVVCPHILVATTTLCPKVVVTSSSRYKWPCRSPPDTCINFLLGSIYFCLFFFFKKFLKT